MWRVIAGKNLAEIRCHKIVVFERRTIVLALVSYVYLWWVFHFSELVAPSGRWVMNHPLIFRLKKVILVLVPSDNSRPQVAWAEREIAILAEYLLIDLRVCSKPFLMIIAREVNSLKVCFFHIRPVDVGEIKILVELLRILASLHFASLLDRSVFELS